MAGFADASFGGDVVTEESLLAAIAADPRNPVPVATLASYLERCGDEQAGELWERACALCRRKDLDASEASPSVRTGSAAQSGTQPHT